MLAIADARCSGGIRSPRDIEQKRVFSPLEKVAPTANSTTIFLMRIVMLNEETSTVRKNKLPELNLRHLPTNVLKYNRLFFAAVVVGELQMCFHICADKSSTYFGITKGYECGCGIATNFLDTEKPEGTCETPCRGDAKQTCGDETSYDLFRLYDNKADEEFDYSGRSFDYVFCRYSIHSWPFHLSFFLLFTYVPLTNVPFSVFPPTTHGDMLQHAVLLCSNGMNGVMNEEEDICCPASCLQCGGSRCVGQGSCCDGYVREKEQYCNEDVYLPPCVLRPGTIFL